MSTNQEDPHHCHCFTIHPDYFKEFQNKLKEIDFKKPLLEENHGQVFGLTKRLDEYTQIHVKVMKDGRIEAEMEYPPDYPFAHLNQEHSYSAHQELQELLNSLMPAYTFRRNPPLTCLQRIIKKATNPTPAKVVVGTLVVVGVIGLVAYALSKEGKN